MKEELLRKYCENKYTKDELSSIIDQVNDISQARENMNLMHKLWEELPDNCSVSESNVDSLLDKIHHDINIRKIDRSSKINNYRIFRLVRNAAAILLLPVLGMAFFMSLQYRNAKQVTSRVEQAYNEVYSSVDAITKVTLPDGSNVWLNHRSSLRYPAVFHGNSRTVELSGEGYFEVAHNPELPFVVKTGSIDVVAHGTTFNVLAYPEENKIETYLIEGSVEILKVSPEGDVVLQLELEPSDAAIYNRSDNEISMHKISNESNFSWKDGKLIFIEEDLRTIVNKLSRWYNVDIQVHDHELLDLTFTGTLINETLPQVMELMALVTPIEYAISTRKELSSGNFSKRLVTIKKKK
jgi:ferric-dicitrate binding protein FerR (iron transport regulator)